MQVTTGAHQVPGGHREAAADQEIRRTLTLTNHAIINPLYVEHFLQSLYPKSVQLPDFSRTH